MKTLFKQKQQFFYWLDSDMKMVKKLSQDGQFYFLNLD